MTEPMKSLIEGKKTVNGLVLVLDGSKIVDFLVDSGKSKLLKAMDGGTNIGTAIVFDDDDNKDNLLFLLRIKENKDEEQNGLYGFALLDIKSNKEGKENLKKLLRKGNVGNKEDLDKISDMIDSAVAISISTV